MRLRACIGTVLLGTAACAELPRIVRIDVDGRMLEIRQRGLSADHLKGGWSLFTECGEGGVRGITEEIEVTGPDGRVLRLYRCGA